MKLLPHILKEVIMIPIYIIGAGLIILSIIISQIFRVLRDL